MSEPYRLFAFRTKVMHKLGRHLYYQITRNGEPAKICLCGRYQDEKEAS